MLKVGIDNYCLQSLDLDPMAVLQWAADHGAEGVQFSGLQAAESSRVDRVNRVDRAYLKDLGAKAKALGLYLEWGGGQHIPREMTTWDRKDLFENNRRAAEQAEILGTRIVRSCSGGLMRWNPDSPMSETLLQETADCLRGQQQMLRDHGVLLSLETHFEFTTWEILRIFDRCEAEPDDYLGICLDTMNPLIMLEEPVCAAQRALPWVTATHIKDGALHLDRTGLKAFPTEIGLGQVALGKIIRLLQSQPREIHLSVEDHGGSFALPVFDPAFLSRFPDLNPQEMAGLLRIVTRAEDLKITEREDWPGLCEERIVRDVQQLKEVVQAVG